MTRDLEDTGQVTPSGAASNGGMDIHTSQNGVLAECTLCARDDGHIRRDRMYTLCLDRDFAEISGQISALSDVAFPG